MKKNLNKTRFLVFALTVTALFMIASVTVFAQQAARETVQLGRAIAYTGVDGAAPAYTFDSSLLSSGAAVGAMMFNISIDLPLEGDPSWNDWCGAAVAVRANGETRYYDFGGKEVGWGIDVDGDGNADTGGKDSASWAGSAANGVITVTVPVNASTFSIDFYDNCWDSVAGAHYTINSGTALFGSIAGREQVAVGRGIGYTGVDGASPAYVFSSSAFTTAGNVAAVAFNINIDLPLEGDPSWNDWCGAAVAVTANGVTRYYDFGGREVGWGIDIDGDGNADTGGKDSASWVGSAVNGALSILVPVDASTFTIAFYDNCWDSVAGDHYHINFATALFGSVVEGQASAAPAAPVIPAFDPNGTYRAFLGIQMDNWVFRNAWSDSFYGEDGRGWSDFDANYFNNLFHIDTASTRAGVFTDVEIKGNGTYRVSLRDWDFDGAGAFNQLFVSTNIPLDGENITITNVRIIIGGNTRHTFRQGYVYGISNDDFKDYYEIYAINAWNSDLRELFNDMVPASGEIAIEFTVSGFAYDWVEPAAPASNALMIILIIAGALIVIGAVVLVIFKKKKK